MPLVSDLLGQPVSDDVRVTSIACDSRKMLAGGVFFAISGTAQNGATFIADAIAKGAVAVVSEDTQEGLSVPHIQVENARYSLAKAAAAFYPKQPQHIAAITGTNGKTSIADFCRQLWQAHNYDAVSIGTLGWNGNTDALSNAFGASTTSPDAILLHEGLHHLAHSGIQHVALEASSHGLDQHRLDGANITSAAFTNLSHDHLDYHKDMQHYLAAKLRLFNTLLPADGTAIIHADDSYSSAFMDAARTRTQRIWDVGTQAETLRIIAMHPVTEGIEVSASLWGETHHFTLPLFGAFQVSNALIALGLVVAEGMDKNAAIAQLQNLQGVPGRLQHVADANDARIFIDYAHTPDALHTILLTLRPHCAGRLHVLFGCGGDRDKTKRPEMGSIAVQHADKVTITDDNPRSENPAHIRSEILATALGATEIADRAEAIAYSVQNLEPGDLLVVAGKGHEDYQIIGEQTLHFNDAEEIRKVATAL